MNINFDNIIHFVGMNNKAKEEFIDEMPDIVIQDLDKITLSFRNDPHMITLNNKLKRHINDSTKNRGISKEIHQYWKELFQHKVNNIIKRNKNKKIIFIGLSTYHKNHSVRIKIPTSKKYFIKSNINNHIDDIIEYNLDRYRFHIIKGNFPIKYLDREFLIKQRRKVEKLYERMGFTFKSMNQIRTIINKLEVKEPKRNKYKTQFHNNIKKGGTLSTTTFELVKSSNNNNANDNINEKNIWYVALTKNIKGNKIKVTPEDNGPGKSRKLNIHKFLFGGYKSLSIHKEPWLATLNGHNGNQFHKGYLRTHNTKIPFVEEKVSGSFIDMHNSIYLYKINYNGDNRKNSLTIKDDVNIINKQHIEDVYYFLKKNGVRLVRKQNN